MNVALGAQSPGAAIPSTAYSLANAQLEIRYIKDTFDFNYQYSASQFLILNRNKREVCGGARERAAGYTKGRGAR